MKNRFNDNNLLSQTVSCKIIYQEIKLRFRKTILLKTNH